MRAASSLGLVAMCVIAAGCGMAAWLLFHHVPPSPPGEGLGQVVAPAIEPGDFPEGDSSGEAARPQGGPGLVGRYACRGENAGGQSYGGTVSISRKGDLYYLAWSLGRSETHRGIGVRHGQVLSVSFVTSDQNMGVVAYQIQEVDGRVRLDGRWAIFGMATPRTETLVRQTRSEQISDSI